jgi:hypothetical protein
MHLLKIYYNNYRKYKTNVLQHKNSIDIKMADGTSLRTLISHFLF